MNTHPTELLPAYILGALTAEEARLVSDHLGVCPTCREEAEDFRASVGLAPNMPRPKAPPAHIKRHLFARVHATRPVRGMGGMAASVAFPTMNPSWSSAFAVLALIVALVLGAMMMDARRQLVSVQESLQQYQASGQDQMAAFLSDPATVSQPMSGAAASVNAKMYMQVGHNRAVLLASGLPSLAPGTTYQFWFASEDAQVPSKTFTVDAEGVAQVILDAPAPVNSYGEVMVTVEPVGGSTTPSGEVVLQAALAA